MTLRTRMSRWWFDFHQRGIFTHCFGVFWWCVADNIAHSWLRVPLDQDLCDDPEDWPDVPDHWGYWICRRHDAALARNHRKHER